MKPVYNVEISEPENDDARIIGEVKELVTKHKRFLQKMMETDAEGRTRNISYRLVVKHPNMLALRQRLARDPRLREMLEEEIGEMHGGRFATGLTDMLIH